MVTTTALNECMVQQYSTTRKTVGFTSEIVQPVAFELEVARLPGAAEAVLLAFLLLEPAHLLWSQVGHWIRYTVVVGDR